MEELISIIVPVYNVKKYIRKCIDSIIAQTYKNVEIILVDDESNDGSERICEQYKEMDKRIRVIHKKNGGLSSARNCGLEIANGQYIEFVDSDDWIEKNYTEVLYKTLKKYNADLSICGIKMCYDRKCSKMPWFGKDQSYEKEVAMEYLVGDKIISSHAWNKLYKKELFNSIRFPDGKLYEDVRIMHNIFCKCKKIGITKEYLYNYRQREASITTENNFKNKIEYIEAFEKRYNDLKNTKFEELALYAYMRVIMYTIVMQKYSKKQIKKYKDYIKEKIKFIRGKNQRKIFLKYASKKEKVIYLLGVVLSNHMAWIFQLNKNLKRGRNEE